MAALSDRRSTSWPLDPWLPNYCRDLSTDRAVSRYGLFFYTYGVYLHCGYEHSFISPHNGVINTSFQHYAHHARSPVCGPFIRQQSGNTCQRSHVRLCLKHFFMKADSSDWIFFKKNALCKLKFCKLKFCFCNLIPTQPSSIQC